MIPRFLRLACAAFAGALLLVAGPAAAQGTATVPLDDPAYLYLDRLQELGLADSAVMGQRPYSHREMARLARLARAAATTRPRDGDGAVVDALVDMLESRLRSRPGDASPALAIEALAGVNATDAVRRAPPPAGSGISPQATIDPLALRRLGEPFPRGRSAYADVLARAEPAPWLAFRVRGRLTASAPDDAALPARRGEVLEASARARWRNTALTVGREQTGWGSGSVGGLFLAADAPALDEIVLSSDHPFLLPGFLRRAGPVSGTFVLAEMGPSTVRSKSKMLAYKVSAQPAAGLELGATFQNHFGGEGGRRSSFLYRVIDFLPMIDIFRRHNYVDTTVVFDVDSDKAIGMDARWRIDALGGVVVAGEILVDDFDVHRLANLLNSAGSHTLLVTLPRLGSPPWALRLGAVHMGPLTYTHATLTQGMTTRGRLLGNELGPDARSFWADLRWVPAKRVEVAVEARSSIYSNALYSSGYDINGRWVVEKRGSAPDELRELAIATVAVEPSSAARITLRGGLERTRNVMFTGARRRIWVADVGVRWRP